MQNKVITNIFISIVALLIFCNFYKKECQAPMNNKSTVELCVKKPVIHIILGSTRKGRISDKIGAALKRIIDTKANALTEIIDLRDYNLPFLSDDIPPATRETITDAAVQKWSDTIKMADAFIIVTPEYNAGYPGVLKNALDSLYKEWNGKSVGFVGYSGGASGGTSTIAQLRQVAHALKMKTVESDVTIGNSWKALDDQGMLTEKNIETNIFALVEQLVNSVQKNNTLN